MKWNEFLGMLLAVGALFQACSSGTSGSASTSTGTGGNSPSTGGVSALSSSAGGSAGTQQSGGRSGSGGMSGRMSGSGGVPMLGGTNAGGTLSQGGGGPGGAAGGATGFGGTSESGGSGGVPALGGASGTVTLGGTTGRGGTGGLAGSTSAGGVTVAGGSSGAAGSGGNTSCGAAGSGPVGALTDPIGTNNVSPPNPPGITFKDTDGNLVDAHGGGIIRVCNTFYLHGEYFTNPPDSNDFSGFSMYSSTDMATWKFEKMILPVQPSGQLGPNRKGERPHIIKCPATGEFVLYAHSADLTYQVDKEVVYATSPTVNGVYSFKGSLTNASGTIAAHSDMTAFADDTGAYVATESGWVYPLASDCHSWKSANHYSAVNGTTGGSEAPTIFRAGSTYYWIGSDKTGWRANDNFYCTAPAMTGPWTYQGYLAPVGKLTWMTQTTWVQPVVGSLGTVYMFWGDHWYGDQNTTAPGKYNYLTTYVFQPIVFTGNKISLPTYNASWKLDIGAGTRSP